MTRIASILFFVVVAAQVVGLVAFAGAREVALTEGREITLQTAPVDPRSLFQGDYAILDYEIAELPPRLAGQPAGANVYVILAECGDVWCGSQHTLTEPESSDVYIRGVINADGRLDFGIGTYFVPEGTGHIIERAEDVKVVVSLDERGQAVIKRVLVDGEPFAPGGNWPLGMFRQLQPISPIDVLRLSHRADLQFLTEPRTFGIVGLTFR